MKWIYKFNNQIRLNKVIVKDGNELKQDGYMRLENVITV